MTLIAAIYGGNEIFCVSDLKLSNSPGTPNGFKNPINFGNQSSLSEANLSVCPKTVIKKSHLLMWSGAKFLFDSLLNKLDFNACSEHNKEIIDVYSNDAYVRENLSIIYCHLGDDLRLSHWGCHSFSLQDKERGEGDVVINVICAGSGAGDLYFGYENFEESDLGPLCEMEIVQKILILSLMREQYESGFDSKAYGLGYRVIGVRNSKFEVIDYKADFFEKLPNGTSVGFLGGYRNISKGKREYVVRIDADLSLQAHSIGASAPIEDPEFLQELYRLQSTKEYEFAIASLHRPNQKLLATTIDPKQFKVKCRFGKKTSSLTPVMGDALHTWIGSHL